MEKYMLDFLVVSAGQG